MENTYNGTKFCNVLRVKLAVYPVYFTGNTANSTAVYRKHRKNPTLVRKIYDGSVFFVFMC